MKFICKSCGKELPRACSHLECITCRKIKCERCSKFFSKQERHSSGYQYCGLCRGQIKHHMAKMYDSLNE